MGRPKGQVCTLLLLVFLFLEDLGGRRFVAPEEQELVSVRFDDVTDESGIRFRHFNAASSKKYILETMGSGCAWVDFDNDGLLDAFFVNGGATPEVKPTESPRHALFRNRGKGSFEEVTTTSRVGGDGSFGMGVAVGDYNNDSYPDLFVSGYPHLLLHDSSRGIRQCCYDSPG